MSTQKNVKTSFDGLSLAEQMRFMVENIDDKPKKDSVLKEAGDSKKNNKLNKDDVDESEKFVVDESGFILEYNDSELDEGITDALNSAWRKTKGSIVNTTRNAVRSGSEKTSSIGRKKNMRSAEKRAEMFKDFHTAIKGMTIILGNARKQMEKAKTASEFQKVLDISEDGEQLDKALKAKFLEKMRPHLKDESDEVNKLVSEMRKEFTNFVNRVSRFEEVFDAATGTHAGKDDQTEKVNKSIQAVKNQSERFRQSLINSSQMVEKMLQKMKELGVDISDKKSSKVVDIDSDGKGKNNVIPNVKQLYDIF